MTPRQIVRKLESAGFDTSAIVEVHRDEIVIGYVTDGGVALDDADRTDDAMELASAILGWSGFSCNWGGWILTASHQPADPELTGFADPIHY